MVTMNPRVTEKTIAKMGPVQELVKVVADDLEGAAQSALAPHRKTGGTEIKKRRSTKRLDWIISLEDSSEGSDIMAFEYGHDIRLKGEGRPKDGRVDLHKSHGHVAGARVLGRALAGVI